MRQKVSPTNERRRNPGDQSDYSPNHGRPVDGGDLREAVGNFEKPERQLVVEHTKGPKIRIHKFKNKTGYHKRQGHRQQLTVLKVTGIK